MYDMSLYSMGRPLAEAGLLGAVGGRVVLGLCALCAFRVKSSARKTCCSLWLSKNIVPW